MTPARILIIGHSGRISTWLSWMQQADFDARAMEAHDPITTTRSQEPDLLVLDVSEEAAAGLEVVEALRRDEAWAKLPIILFSANADDKERIAGLDAGADDYLTGPASPQEFIARVHVVLRRVYHKGGGA